MKQQAHTIKHIAEQIRKHKRFVISGHIRLDGDSVGSSFALATILKRLGKEVFLAHNAAVPSKYLFLCREKVPESTRAVSADVDCLITVDCPDASREEILNSHYSDKTVVLNIDHHKSNHMYGHYNWIDADAAAVGEMIFDLAKELGVQLDLEIAVPIYVSIVTDTGRFAYSNVTPRTHRLVSELVATGLNVSDISREIYYSRPAEYWRLASRAIQSLKVECAGRLAYIVLRQADFKEFNYTPEESQDFVDFPGSIKGVQVFLYFRETEKGRLKVSFRSATDAVNVNELAGLFGGGGHVRASGALLDGPFEDAVERVLGETRKRIPA